MSIGKFCKYLLKNYKGAIRQIKIQASSCSVGFSLIIHIMTHMGFDGATRRIKEIFSRTTRVLYIKVNL